MKHKVTMTYTDEFGNVTTLDKELNPDAIENELNFVTVAFKDFLVAAGFVYVDNVHIISDRRIINTASELEDEDEEIDCLDCERFDECMLTGECKIKH